MATYCRYREDRRGRAADLMPQKSSSPKTWVTILMKYKIIATLKIAVTRRVAMMVSLSCV